MSEPSARLPSYTVDYIFGPGPIASMTAPTVAELGAVGMTRIECAVIDHPDPTRSANEVDITAACDTVERKMAGRKSMDAISTTLYRELIAPGTDEYWTLFDDSAEPALTQYLVVCRAGFTGGVPTIGDVVEVYQVQIGARSPVQPSGDDAQRFMVELLVVSSEMDAVVA